MRRAFSAVITAGPQFLAPATYSTILDFTHFSPFDAARDALPATGTIAGVTWSVIPCGTGSLS